MTAESPSVEAVESLDSAWQPLAKLVEQGVSDGVFAGAAVCVRAGGRVVARLHRGSAELRPLHRPLRRDHPFDVASLTKVLATTPVILSLAGDGALDLDAPVADHLDGVAPGVTARLLLQHASGLPAWLRLYEDVEASGLRWGSPAARALAMRRSFTAPLAATPGTVHRYSDLGFLTLGALAEACGGDRLDRLWEQRVRRPSGVDLRWGWPDAAATEDCPVRRRVVVGEVHDLNAASMGGIAAHAGLFGSADAVAGLAAWQLRAFHGARDGLDPSLAREMWTDKGPGSHLLGWDGVTQGASSAGPRWPLDGVGHLGFTGCSLWVAPQQHVVVAFLSNRVHPEIAGGAVPNAPISPRFAAFRQLRPALHSTVVQSLCDLGLWKPVSR